MGLFDKLKGVAVRKFAEKYIKGSLKTAIGVGVVWLAKNVGLELTNEQQAALLVAATGFVFGVTNQLKHKFPKAFGWI